MCSTATYSIPHAYRLLLRSGLRAIQYSTPARYTLTTLLRREFRPLHSHLLTDAERHSRASQTSLPASSIDNIVAFFERCAREKGIEHDVVRNLLYVEYWNWSAAQRPGGVRIKSPVEDEYWEVVEGLRGDLMGERVRVDTERDIRMREDDERFKHNEPIR